MCLRSSFLLLYAFLTIAVPASGQDDYPFSVQVENRIQTGFGLSADVTTYDVWARGQAIIGLEKYNSDPNSQKLFKASFSTVAFRRFPDGDFSPVNFSVSTSYLKTKFFRNNYFLEFNPSLSIRETNHFERTVATPFIQAGAGKGRIDRVNERAVVETIIKELSQSEELNKQLIDDVSRFIRELKNERRYYNLGSVHSELEELVSYLKFHGIINEELSQELNISLTKKIYKNLPSMERTEGRKFGISSSVSTSYRHYKGDKIYDLWRTFGRVGMSAYFAEHDYLSRKFQFIRRASVSTVWIESYDRGYAISEEISIEGAYYPALDTRFSMSAGIYNRWHTLDKLFSYGLEIGGGIRKTFDQRRIINCSFLARLDFNRRPFGNVSLEISI